MDIKKTIFFFLFFIGFLFSEKYEVIYDTDNNLKNSFRDALDVSNYLADLEIVINKDLVKPFQVTSPLPALTNYTVTISYDNLEDNYKIIGDGQIDFSINLESYSDVIFKQIEFKDMDLMVNSGRKIVFEDYKKEYVFENKIKSSKKISGIEFINSNIDFAKNNICNDFTSDIILNNSSIKISSQENFANKKNKLKIVGKDSNALYVKNDIDFLNDLEFSKDCDLVIDVEKDKIFNLNGYVKNNGKNYLIKKGKGKIVVERDNNLNLNVIDGNIEFNFVPKGDVSINPGSLFKMSIEKDDILSSKVDCKEGGMFIVSAKGKKTLLIADNFSGYEGTLLVEDGIFRCQAAEKEVDLKDEKSSSLKKGVIDLSDKKSKIIYEQINNDGATLANFQGIGTIKKIGKHNLELLGDNTDFQGKTVIQNGSIEVFGNKSIPNQVKIKKNGKFIFNLEKGYEECLNLFTGPGIFEKKGEGDLFLANERFAIKRINILEGSLSSNSKFLKDFYIKNDSILNLDQDGDGVLDFDIDQDKYGTMVKMGRGKLEIPKERKINQSVINIKSGILAVNGDVKGNSILVNFGTILKGNGNIDAKVKCRKGGVFNPGNSIDTITVGSLQVDNGGILEMEFDPSNSDIINVTNAPGNVTFSQGSLLVIVPYEGIYPSQFSYDIINYSGIRIGEISNIYSNYPVFFPTLDYDDLNKKITLTIAKSFQNANLKNNPRRVARYLDSLSPAAGSDLEYAFNKLTFLTTNEIYDALDQLHGSDLKSFSLVKENNDYKLLRNVSGRLEEYFKTSCNKMSEKNKGHHIWFSPELMIYNQRDYNHLVGFRNSSFGAVLGYDFGFENNFFLGGAVSYQYADIDQSSDRGKGNINTFNIGLYSLYFRDHFFIDMALFSEMGFFDYKRNIKFNGVNRVAKSDHFGGGLMYRFKMGGSFDTTTFEVIPYVSLDYNFLHENSFKESGADSLNLNYNSKNYNSIRTEVGLNFTRCNIFKSCYFIPEMGISYVSEVRFDGKYYTLNFENQNNTFKVRGMRPDRSFIAPSANFSWVIYDERGVISIGYHGEFGKHADNHFTDAKLIWNF